MLRTSRLLVAFAGLAMLASGLFVQAASPSDAQRQATGYTYLHSDGYQHYACKRWFNTSYGGVYEIRTMTIDGRGGLSRNRAKTVTVATKRNGQYFNWQHNSRWWLKLNAQKFYISASMNDRFWIQVNGYGPATRSFSPRNIVRCR